MSTVDDARKKAAATYNAASDFYDHPANTFWERYGRRTIERSPLPEGAHVLDVCCGSGASAIPAAGAVGPCGSVPRSGPCRKSARTRACESDEPETLRSLLTSASLTEIDVVPEAGSQPVNSPDDWWAMVVGSGYRGTVDQLSAAEREQVRAENLDFIRRERIDSVEANVIYAIGKKP